MELVVKTVALSNYVASAAAASTRETVNETFTISCPDNKNIVYCVWQLIDEFRIIGVDGEEFTDPYYKFTPGSHLAVCPTPEYVPMTTFLRLQLTDQLIV